VQELQRVNDEVYYAGSGVVLVGPEELEFIKQRARENGSARARICTHPSTQDGLHEMFIVHGRGAYVRPHAHAVKAESFWLVEGSCDVVFFEDDGGVRSWTRLGTAEDTQRYYRIPPLLYHTLLIRSEWLVFHEVTTGPFVRSEALFPSWAPDGTDAAEAAAYIADLEHRIREGDGV
jgi:cupin fold WbuC family metalloprotein